MSSRALLNWDSQTVAASVDACAELCPGVRRDSWDGNPVLLAEAAGILEDVRRVMKFHPADARAAALRLVTLFTPPAAVETADLRGGLAPWQKRKVDRYLREHLEQPLWLDELAEQIPLSVSHFCRAFAKSFGKTPHAYIIRLRIERAQELMLSTDEPLSQIALACGLTDQAHLSKLFRRWVGETPSAWRRRNLTDAQAEARGCRSTASGQLLSRTRA